MRPLTRKALKDLAHYKIRLATSIGAIALGVLGLTATAVASGQMSSSVTAADVATSPPDIVLFTSPAPAGMAARLQRDPNVTIVQTGVYESTRWKLGNTYKPLNLVGLSQFAHLALNRFSLIEGTYPKHGQVLMESNDRSLGPVDVGSRITVQVGRSRRQLAVSGLTRTQEHESPDLTGTALAYVREDDLQNLYHVSGINYFLVKIRHTASQRPTARRLAVDLENQGILVLASQIGSAGSDRKIARDLFLTLRILSGAALMLAAVVLWSTLVSLIAEQRPEIRTLRALGATHESIVRGYVTLGVLYGVAGSVLGLLCGLVVGDALVRYLQLLFSLDVGRLTLSAQALLLGPLIGAIVAFTTAVISVTRETRFLQVHNQGTSIQDRAAIRWRFGSPARDHTRRLPPTILLGLAHLITRRARVVPSLVALILCGAAILGVQATAYSVSGSVSALYSNYRADVFVSLPRPQLYSRTSAIVRSVPGVLHVEPLIQIVADSRWGSVHLIGISPRSTLYRHHLLVGRWLIPGERGGALIGARGAAKAHLRLGDRISVHDDLHTAQWHIVGVVDTTPDAIAGPAGFGVLLSSAADINRFEHLPPSYSQELMLSSANSTDASTLALAHRISERLAEYGEQADVSTASQYATALLGQFSSVYAVLFGLALTTSLTAVIALSSLLGQDVLSRRKEIGILRGMGASSASVARPIWVQGLALTALALIPALCLGVLEADIVVIILSRTVLPVSFSASFSGLLSAFVLIMLVAVAGTIRPVWMGCRVDAAHALKHE